jgi:hypothetical protein
MAVFYCVQCKQSFFGCNMFTLICCSVSGKTSRYFLLQLLVSAAVPCFLFLTSCSMSKRLHAVLKTVFCKWSTALFPLVDLPLKTVFCFQTVSKNTPSSRHDFVPPTTRLYLNVHVPTPHSGTTQQHITY